jgi:DNA-binding NarL/FixJ family response regulator
VDDHLIFREGLNALIARDDQFRVVGEAADGRDAVRLARSLSPKVVSMNVSMPGLNGIDATRQIVSELPDVKVVGLSHSRDHRVVTEMLAAGASGYVLKSGAFVEYADALRAAAQGRTYLSTAVAEPLVREYLGSSTPGRGPLSAREREVLQLISEGLPTREVARQLHISTKTVDTHRRQIMEKLGRRSIAELTKYAIREGLTTLD